VRREMGWWRVGLGAPPMGCHGKPGRADGCGLAVQSVRRSGAGASGRRLRKAAGGGRGRGPAVQRTRGTSGGTGGAKDSRPSD